MLRSALLLAVIFTSATFAAAQNTRNIVAPNKQADQGLTAGGKADAAASTTAKDLPYPDMMRAWEYAPQEWK